MRDDDVEQSADSPLSSEKNDDVNDLGGMRVVPFDVETSADSVRVNDDARRAAERVKRTAEVGADEIVRRK